MLLYSTVPSSVLRTIALRELDRIGGLTLDQAAALGASRRTRRPMRRPVRWFARPALTPLARPLTHAR